MTLQFTKHELPLRTRYQSNTTYLAQNEARVALDEFEDSNGLSFDEVLWVPLPRGGHALFAYTDKPTE